MAKRAGPEKEIENDILNFLVNICKIFAYKNERVGTYDPIKKTFRKNYNPYKLRGVVDITAIIDGRYFAIEVKSKVGRVSEEQVYFMEKITDSGGVSIVARSLEQCIINLLPHLQARPDLTALCNKQLISVRGPNET